MSDSISTTPGMRSAVYDVVGGAERERLDAYLAVDLAHVLMLHECGIAPRAVASSLLGGLRRAYARLADDPPLAHGHQSLLFAVETLLREEIGEAAAGYLQTARSRLDQSQAARRLHCRGQLLDVAAATVELQGALLQRARDWEDVHIAGWTHLQQSQPWNMAHYMLSLFDRTGRDLERVLQCLDRTDFSALGAAAMVGTDWPIDRDRVAALLGHRGTVANALDAATLQADFPAEVAATLSLLACNMARWAADFYVWNSSEFGLVTLDIAHCGTSSIMPQKRNPVALARIRALAGQSVGWFPAQLATMKSPTSSDCDAFYVSAGGEVPVVELVEVIQLGTEVIRRMHLNRERCGRALDGTWCTLSALADVLVRHCAIDFRTAHAVVAELARMLREQGRVPQAATVADVAAAARSAADRDLSLPHDLLRRAVDPQEFARSRTSAGGTAPGEIRAQLDAAEAALKGRREEIDSRLRRVADAAATLRAACDELVAHQPLIGEARQERE
jgi:argininosuccinate lyase